jgi:hypothetical protein
LVSECRDISFNKIQVNELASAPVRGGRRAELSLRHAPLIAEPMTGYELLKDFNGGIAYIG